MDLYSFKFIILVLNEIKNQLCNEFYVKARIPTMKLVYKESGLWVGSFWSFELCGAVDFSVWDYYYYCCCHRWEYRTPRTYKYTCNQCGVPVYSCEAVDAAAATTLRVGINSVNTTAVGVRRSVWIRYGITA